MFPMTLQYDSLVGYIIRRTTKTVVSLETFHMNIFSCLTVRRLDFKYASDSQECVFDVTTKAMLDGFLSGTSCLIMAYGVTGSGKTYTIMGPKEFILLYYLHIQK